MSNQLNVLHLLDTCAMGGAEKMLVEMLTNAHKQGKNWHFISFRGGVLYPQFEASGAPCTIIGRKKVFDIATVKKLRNYIKHHSITVVHTHAIMEAFYVSLAILGLKVKLVHTYHGYAPNEGKKDTIARRFAEIFINKHVFVSKDLEFFFKKSRNLGKNVATVENGTDLSTLMEVASNPLKKELKISNENLLFGMIGNFNSTGRDQLTICKALAALPTDLKFTFVFIGGKNPNNPHFFDDCVTFCESNNLGDKVFFLGQRENAQSYLHEFNAYIYASNHDSFGLTLIEAMARKVPLIVNDLEPFKVITENGKYATLYPTKDYHKLAEIIKSFVDNPQPFFDKLEPAAVHVQNKYSIERVIKNYCAIYDQILK